jgi:hypothetical protein
MNLAGIAKNDGDEHPVYLRAARQGDAYYIDLSGDDWRAVEVRADGWKVVDRPPRLFLACFNDQTAPPAGSGRRPVVTVAVCEHLRTGSPTGAGVDAGILTTGDPLRFWN